MEKEFSQLKVKLENIENLLRHLLVIELNRHDVPQQEIGKHIKVSTGTVNKMLKGVKKQK